MRTCFLLVFGAACCLAQAPQHRGFFETVGSKADAGSKIVAEKVSDGSQRTAHAVKEGSVAVASTTASHTKEGALKVAHLFKR